MSETDIDYDKLAEALLRNEAFANRVAKSIATSTKISIGEFKSQVEHFCASWRKQREEEIKSDLDGWFFSHIKRQIESSKVNFTERINREVEAWLDNKLDSSFKDAGKQVIEKLIRDKFADTRVSFSIRDLFDDRDD